MRALMLSFVLLFPDLPLLPPMKDVIMLMIKHIQKICLYAQNKPNLTTVLKRAAGPADGLLVSKFQSNLHQAL